MGAALSKALPSEFEYRGFCVRYERKQGPGADWEFFSLGWDGDPEDRSPRGHAATAGEVIEEIDCWLAENEAPASVAAAIEAHRAAVMVDEASFTDDCEPICKKRANVTGAAEIAAFRDFVDAPCRSVADVNAKVAYALAPPIGDREANANWLAGDESWNACEGPERLRAFLRSLIVSVEARP